MNKIEKDLIKFYFEMIKELLKNEKQKEIFVTFIKNFPNSLSNVIQLHLSFSDLYKNLYNKCNTEQSVEVYLITKEKDSEGNHKAKLILHKLQKQDNFTFIDYSSNVYNETLNSIFENFSF